MAILTGLKKVPDKSFIGIINLMQISKKDRKSFFFIKKNKKKKFKAIERCSKLDTTKGIKYLHLVLANTEINEENLRITETNLNAFGGVFKQKIIEYRKNLKSTEKQFSYLRCEIKN